MGYEPSISPRSLHKGASATSASCLLLFYVDAEEFEEKSGLKHLRYSHGNVRGILLFCGAQNDEGPQRAAALNNNPDIWHQHSRLSMGHYFPLIREQVLGGEESFPWAADTPNRKGNIQNPHLHFPLLSQLWNL